MLDFIDIGSSKGGSVHYCIDSYGPNGYGIDIDKEKVKQAQADGLDVRWQSIHDVRDRAKVVTMIHVLEHLDGREQARGMINECLRIGERVYISLPFFDADAPYLYNMNLKLFWSDWTGHTYQPSTLELYNLLRDTGRQFEMEYYKGIEHAHAEEIVPLSAPKDSLGYKLEMGPKPERHLFDVWREHR